MPSSKQAVVTCPVCSASHVPSGRNGAPNGVHAATCVHCGHFFKFRSVPPFKSTITLTVNGQQYTVGNKYSPSTVLNSWLRDNRISVGTKHMCYEGGCGTCLVEVKLFEPISEQHLSYAVNSCLAPLFGCDGWEIRTVEHIGNLRDGLHPIQKQIADYNGSQCGYCTPGQVMNMFALKEMYGTGLTRKQVEDSFDGIICRCTGYRPILAAFKDMAIPHTDCQGSVGDIEDFKGKFCKKSGKPCSGTCHPQKPELATHIVFADTQWFRPTSEEEVTATLDANKGKKIRFLMGNTSTGIYSDQGAGNYDVVMDLTSFREMYSISFDTDIIFGGGLTLTQLIDIFNRSKQESDLAYLGQCAELLSRVANLPIRNFDTDVVFGAGLTLTQLIDIFNRVKVSPDSHYFGECEQLLSRVANLPIRNRATWAGNIVLKHVHNEFPSDVLVMLQVLKASLWTGFMGDSIKIAEFLTTDITNKLILAFSFTTLDADETIKFYKVQPRAQNAHCYVTGGFRVKLDKTSGFIVKQQPVIAYGGIGTKFNRAFETELYLNGKNLMDPNVLKTALITLGTEIQVDTSPVVSSATYRKNVALALLYKFVLHILGDKAGAPYRSAASQLFMDRPISSGIQTYDTNKVEWPVTEPLKKLEANAQACGEADYVDDMPAYPNQLEAAFVLSTVGSAKLGTIDATEALKIPGVVKVITAKDIPGTNSFFPASFPSEEVLASDTISYCGQPVAIVLADAYGTALGAVYAVKVTYTDIQTPILTIQDAIQKKSFYPKQCDDVTVGDPDTVIASSPKKITGSISMGTQYHFHMETQASLCVPTSDGMDVYSTTQWLDLCQSAISQVTGLPKNSINLQVKRLGGAYGGKITRNSWIAAACGLAAHLTNRPVKLRLTLGDNMKMMGKRYPYMAEYEVGFTDVGQLNAIKVTYYGNSGNGTNDNAFPVLQLWADNAYYCPNWFLSCVAVKTNTPTNTAARSPGSLPAIFVIESIMEHVAKSLNKDATDIRMLNTYTNSQTDPLTKTVLTNCELKPMISNFQRDVDYTTRVQDIQTFNTANRWKKKGISVVPLKMGISWAGAHYGCQVSIYWDDGTVAISHGGVEIGQGINTKVAQVCAYELGLPLDMIKIKPTNSLITANGVTTGGSITSENCCAGVIECCKSLNARIAPVKAKVKDPTWKNVLMECYAEGIDLSARYWTNPNDGAPFRYYSYGATIAEVELDVLTGEHTLSRVDVLFDCGESTNPALDVGQAEGAFVMGLGYWLTEQCKYDPESGALVTDSTWEYKPPSSKDIPVIFNVSFVPKNPNPRGTLGAKAVGEPPLCMSCAALFALKRAIEAARKDIGQDTFFPLDGPATPEACQLLCMTDPSQFVIA